MGIHGGRLVAPRGGAVVRRCIGVLAALAVAAGTLVAVSTTVTAESASALSAADFDPGNIISDANFYDAQAMSSAEIQGFLDAKIGTCFNGQCLNVLTVPVDNQAAWVSSRTGNLVCSAFSGGNLRVSELIYRVQVACGISAKVILVTLQKEQSLTTSQAPSSWALTSAMGMACPDTAPCDSAYSGLARQIISGVGQLKNYKAGRFARQPGVQYVQYNPNASCGGTNVNVRNYATAALYNYTPYQPNPAALANIGGLGNSCSSYGNRNFWAYYSNWFGSPVGTPKAYSNVVPFVVSRNADGQLLIYTGNGRGGWAAAGVVGQGWNGMRLLTVGGDFDGDGNRDILAVDGPGNLWLYPTNGYSQVSEGVKISGGWGAVTTILTPGDITGDFRDDVIAVDGAGVMTLYPGNGQGGFLASRAISGSWSGLTSILSVGDFNGDRKGDLMSIDASGALWLHPGAGFGEFGARVQIGTGWGIMNLVLGARDFDGDGATDLLARRTNGDLWLYRGDGRGDWRNGYIVGNGWNTMTAMAMSGTVPITQKDQVGAGDLDGDGLRDVLAAGPNGELWGYQGVGRGNIGGAFRIAGDWSATTFMSAVGDFNGDGFRDVVSTDTSGALWLQSVQGAGLGAATNIGGGWNAMAKVLSPGDFNGDGVSDLLAVDASGNLWLYAGPLLNATIIGSGFNGVTEIVGVGDFDVDGAADLLVRWPNGDFFNYRGDGRGSWADKFPQVGNGWNIFDSITGPGDFDGDGYVDVLARRSNGDLWLYPGDGRGDWKAPRQVGTGWNIMRWIS